MSEQEAKLNPSYNRALPASERLADFLGKFIIVRNGNMGVRVGELSQENKAEIVHFVVNVLMKEQQDKRNELIDYVTKEIQEMKHELMNVRARE